MPEYFTLDELRALPDMAQESTARIEAAAAWAVGIIEREVGTSFVARTVTDEAHDGDTSVILAEPYILSITSVSESGTPVVGAVTAKYGILRRPSGSTAFVSGYGNVLVTYQAGYSTTPPPDIKEAALQATRWHLLEGRASNVTAPRQTSFSNDMGGTTNLATAGPDRPTGYPDVDAVIIGWRNRISLPSFGFA